MPGLGNPFRTRLTHDTCVQLGIPDYISVVGEAVDLTLAAEASESATTKMIRFTKRRAPHPTKTPRSTRARRRPLP